MTINEILNYTLLKTSSLNITVSTIISIFATIIVTSVILRIVKQSLKRIEQKKKIDSGSVTSIFQILKYLVWVIAIAAILTQSGFSLTILLASSAALLVGLGLGIQQIFGDIVSGLLILFEQNVKVGDVLEIENGQVGKIVSIGLRTSKFKTRDDIIMIIPNSKFVSDSTINLSHIEGRTRFHVNVGVAYGSDTKLVKSVLLRCASGIKDISKMPQPFVRFLDFGESSLDFQLYFWTSKIFLVENIKSELRFLIDDEFRINNIQIPYPQRDLHIITDKTK